MNVQLPDGTIVEDVPEGTTRAELGRRLQASGRSVPTEWMSPAPSAPPQPSPQGGQSYWGDVASNILPGLGRIAAGVGQTVAHPLDTAAGMLELGYGGLKNLQSAAQVKAGPSVMGTPLGIPAILQGA